MTGRNTEAIKQLREEIERVEKFVSSRLPGEVVSPNVRVTDPKEQQEIESERLRIALGVETEVVTFPPMGQEQPERIERASPRPWGQEVRWNSEERNYELTGRVVEKPCWVGREGEFRERVMKIAREARVRHRVKAESRRGNIRYGGGRHDGFIW